MGGGEKPTTLRLLLGREMLQHALNNQHRSPTRSAAAAAGRSSVPLLLGDSKRNTQRRVAIQMTPGNVSWRIILLKSRPDLQVKKNGIYQENQANFRRHLQNSIYF